MLNWSQLSLRHRMISVLFLSWVCGSLYAVCFPEQPHAGFPQAGLPLLMLGFLLHPRFFAGGRGPFSWSSAPALVRGLWVIGAVVGAISAAHSLLLSAAGT